MNSRKRTARVAGLLYLIVVLSGIFSLLYVPGALFVDGDAGKTFENIVASETLFRLGIVAGIVCYIAFLFLPIVLYRLLSEVDKNFAVAMVGLALVSVPISFYNLTHKLAVLTIIEQSRHLLGGDGAATRVLFSLEQYNNGISLVAIFWGLWLFPFGYLVFKSGFLPKFFGIFLIAGCFGYVINFFGEFLFSNYSSTGIGSLISLPSAIGEIGICFWLLIAGAKEPTGVGDETRLTQ